MTSSVGTLYECDGCKRTQFKQHKGLPVGWVGYRIEAVAHELHLCVRCGAERHNMEARQRGLKWSTG